jgi:KipI family sensor histidine kinase inhibitor
VSTPDTQRLSVVPFGDTAVTIRLGERVDRALVARARLLAERIRSARIASVREVVVGYASVTVWYDALRGDYAALVSALEHLLATSLNETDAKTARAPREHIIPVTYDGPDLSEVAERTGLLLSEVIRLHSDRRYDVYLVGFVPGWAFLGDLDPALVLPRRAQPRPRVPAGSVAIAGAQTGVYPLATPGGWHLIGRTSVVLFDPAADPPALLQPGDRVKFKPEQG